MRNPNQRIAMARFPHALLVGLLGLLLTWIPAAFAQQQMFSSPEAAMDAFVEALAANDDTAMKGILGADYHAFIPPVGAEARSRFLAESSKSRGFIAEGDAKTLATVGEGGWTFPIPIVKSPQGWRFDTRAGAEEMRIRRIGRNELAVMQVMLAIHDAQNEYAEQDRDGDGVREYAAKFESTPGKKDGLYWLAKEGEEQSPLGPILAKARAAGGDSRSGYYGYHYKLLGSQGKNAPGAAYDYAVRGSKIGGFAVVAWPVKYGDTGVMTFMISHDGKLYEKDLGLQTATRANAMIRFDPDASWRVVQPGG
jgi:hypothetical protein